MRVLQLAVICTILTVQGFAQSKRNYDKYNERATVVRNEIWNWNIPAFQHPDLKDVDTKESAVLLAKHIDLKLWRVKDIDMTSFGAYGGRDIYYSRTVREMIKINDKVALDEYSQFSFKKLQAVGFRRHRTANAATFIGVRIIKPDGAVKEVKVADELVNEEDDDKLQKSKLAIPDLQVGDVIDYYVKVEQIHTPETPIDEQFFVLGEDKPMKQFSVHGDISDKYSVRYRLMNGAPDLKISRKEDGSSFDLLVKNLPSRPTDLWMAPIRQIPLIRMKVSFGLGSAIDVHAAPGTFKKDPSYMDVRDAADAYTNEVLKYIAVAGVGNYKRTVNDMLKTYSRAVKKDIPDDSIPYYAYYAFRYMAFYRVQPNDKINVGLERNYRTSNNRMFLMLLNDVLKYQGIYSDILLVTSRYGAPQKETFNADDFEYVLRTKTPKPVYLSAEGVFTQCAEMLAEYEGQKAPVSTVAAGKPKRGESGYEKAVEIPSTSAEENTHIEKLNISIDNAMSQLLVDRNTILKGGLRLDGQKELLLFEDYYDEERRALGVEQSFMEEFADSKRNRALADEYTNAFAQARKDQKDAFKGEIKGEFDVEPKDISYYKVRKMGLRHTDPDLVYDTKFSMEGFLKKAGNNYIFDIGRIIGKQLQVKAEQRTRTVDIYEPFARSFEHQITLTIPAGYKLEGADKLTRKVDNATGSFIVDSKIDGDKLHVNIIKVYKHSFEKAESWNDLLQVIDAANDFLTQKVLLKKA
ncbi:DUF3857 domain-containing protein [Chitinophaga sp. Cy-1792]|uniref:DUF3857 domain-containing protein n=1 Tax=Chitinophaga sp. Cy-1792 TaxID=2608339 RepID=UPI001423D1A3|nr:DUF3857 domain-containing protein [Chitinophaga sp. Cy-1792]NIG52107.1 DUF3857 domain-containing protein [Chitinophaga sp. Cy-1792]